MMRQAISKKTARRNVSGKSFPQAACPWLDIRTMSWSARASTTAAASSSEPGGRNGTTGTSLPTYSGPSRVTLKSLGLSFMQATTVAYGDWKCRTHPTSGLLRMTPRWKPASIVGRTPFRHRPSLMRHRATWSSRSSSSQLPVAESRARPESPESSGRRRDRLPLLHESSPASAALRAHLEK